ncbi:MAG: Holliday junction branch migration DNA helicase RuvB, partial [Planctomycetes bacterium]|nr:Holliday junction branch migration DNA helicase RuvB [Planctomycetota bacterium]
MARDRLITSEHRLGDEVVDVALRPKTMDEMVGQRSVLEKLEIAMTAAKQRAEPIEHVLLAGPPGLGKTTLANVIATEMSKKPPRVTSGPALAKQADLMAVLTNLERGEVLFIDEIHRLPTPVEEFLYPAMEDFRVDFTIEGGLGGRMVNFSLRRFTLIGATTRSGMLSGAMRDRFGLSFNLDFYSPEELETILRRSAAKLKLKAEEGSFEIIAARSRGTPRVANRLLKRVRDFAQVRGDGKLSERIDVRVQDERGKPIAAAWVGLLPLIDNNIEHDDPWGIYWPPSRKLWGELESDAKGKASLLPTRATRSLVMVWKPGFIPFARPVMATAGPIVVTLRKGTELRMRISKRSLGATNKEAPWGLQLRCLESTTKDRDPRLDKGVTFVLYGNRRYRTTSLPPGRYELCGGRGASGQAKMSLLRPV